PYQPLNFHAATVHAAFRNIASFAWLCGIWKHRVFGSEPAAGHSLLFHPARHSFFNRDGTDHARVTHRDKHRPARMRSRVQLEIERSDFIGYTARSEEHTSELQSRSDLVCRLLLEKKKTV